MDSAFQQDATTSSAQVSNWTGVVFVAVTTPPVTSRGLFNRSEYGYNPVVRIPAGATNIEIQQHGYRYNSKDDTYIALRDVDTNQYILNGDFIMSMFRKTIQYSGITLEY